MHSVSASGFLPYLNGTQVIQLTPKLSLSGEPQPRLAQMLIYLHNSPAMTACQPRTSTRQYTLLVAPPVFPGSHHSMHMRGGPNRRDLFPSFSNRTSVYRTGDKCSLLTASDFTLLSTVIQITSRSLFVITRLSRHVDDCLGTHGQNPANPTTYKKGD